MCRLCSLVVRVSPFVWVQVYETLESVFLFLFCICCIVNCARALCLLVIRASPLGQVGIEQAGGWTQGDTGVDSQRAYPVFSQQRFGVILFFQFQFDPFRHFFS